MVKKGLLISPVFPPAAFPESHLMAKLLSSVPGYQFDVVTFKGWKKWFGQDQSFKTIIDERFGLVEYLDVPAFLRWLPLGRFGSLGKIPDTYRFFNYLLLRKAREMINKNDYEVMVTWSQPHSSHLIGLKLKSSLKSSPKWIAHFSDPWLANPYFKVSGFAKKANETLQHRVLKSADAITVTNSYIVDSEPGFSFFENQNKVQVIPHSFMPELYPEKHIGKAQNPLTIRYIGSFYGPRRPDPLLAALKILEIRNPDLAKILKIEFVGSKLDENALNDIGTLKLTMINILPSVSYRDSLELMQNADLLLIIDAPMGVSPFLPSKLVDYIGSNVPIVAFTPPGPSADVVKELGGWVASPSDANAGYGVLLDALKAITSVNFNYAPSVGVTRRFTAIENGNRFAELIEATTKHSA